jgi:hypothetical protein
MTLHAVSLLAAKNVELERKNAVLKAKAALLENLNVALNENLSSVQAECTRLQAEVRSYRQQCLPLPGWQCPHCRAMNGAAVEHLLQCRCCGAPAPSGDSMEPEEREKTWRPR